MATPKEQLLKTLEDLGGDELRVFQWFLLQGDSSTGLPSIPKSHLDHADRPATVDHMVHTYGSDIQALKITLDVLKKIDRNDLVETLSNTDMVPKGRPRGNNNRYIYVIIILIIITSGI